MGVLEAKATAKRRKDYVQRAVIAAINIGGLIAVAAVAPNTLQLLGKFKATRRFTYQASTVLGRLIKKGDARFEMRGDRKFVTLTAQGKRRLDLDTQRNAVMSRRPKRWDKRWRMVMFDVPEKRKRDRDGLRRTMQEAGFVCFQDSVWLFPYDCEDFVALLKADRRLGNAVRYAIIETLENDTGLRSRFGL